MVIRNREYYTQLNELMEEGKKELDYHVRMANAYKRLCKATVGRRGILKTLYKIAEERNRLHVEKGYQIAKLHLAWCLEEIRYLHENY